MKHGRKKTGLVLEGGGMRGIYTAGVLDVFMENGITFDGVIGVSAGAIHGCSFVSGQKGRSIRYYMKYCRNWQFMSFRSLLLTGNIAGEKFCYHTLPESWIHMIMRHLRKALQNLCRLQQCGDWKGRVSSYYRYEGADRPDESFRFLTPCV